MFAIEINESTMEQCLEVIAQNPHAQPTADIRMFANHHKKWYMVTGYQTRAGKIVDWVVFPENMFRTLFDYGDETMDVTWVQVTFDQRF